MNEGGASHARTPACLRLRNGSWTVDASTWHGAFRHHHQGKSAWWLLGKNEYVIENEASKLGRKPGLSPARSGERVENTLSASRRKQKKAARLACAGVASAKSGESKRKAKKGINLNFHIEARLK